MTKIKEFIGFQGEEIDLEGEQWDELIIKDCPNLTYVDFSGCGLKEFVIENCPKLERLQGYNNQLTELRLHDFPDLTEVFVPFNRLRTLEITECDELQKLHCNNNNLKELDVNECCQLKELYCYRNMITYLDLRKIMGLKFLYAQENRLKECLLDIKPWLIGVDLAENKLTNLDTSRCRKLTVLACRDNLLTSLELSNNKAIVALSASNNYFPPMDIAMFAHLPRLERLIIGTYLPNDIDTESRYQMLVKYQAYNRWYGSLEAFKDSRLRTLRAAETDIESGLEYLPDSVELFLCDSYIKNRKVNKLVKEWNEKQRQKFGSENYPTPPATPPSLEFAPEDAPKPPTSDYEEPHDKDKYRYYNISHEHLTGHITFDGWKNLRVLSVGNNQLKGLTVRNCPNLRFLCYSHNEMEQLATIENCPELRLENVATENYNGKEEWAPWDKHKEQQGTYAQKMRARRIYHEIIARLDNGEKVDSKEILELTNWVNPWWLPFNDALKLIKLWKQKQQEQDNKEWHKTCERLGIDPDLDKVEEEEVEEEDENEEEQEVNKLEELLAQAQQALAQKDFNQLNQLLAEATELAKKLTNVSSENWEQINRLKQLARHGDSRVQLTPANEPSLNLLIGLWTANSILLLVLVINAVYSLKIFSKKPKNFNTISQDFQ